jgi:hypothetical protein
VLATLIEAPDAAGGAGEALGATTGAVLGAALGAPLGLFALVVVEQAAAMNAAATMLPVRTNFEFMSVLLLVVVVVG